MHNAWLTKVSSATTRAKVARWLPLLFICVTTAVVLGMGWHQHLTLERIASHRTLLKEYLTSNALAASLAYMALYVVCVALSLPVGLVLTMIGGLLFGWFLGGLMAVASATAGATIVFLAARSSLGEALGERAGPWLLKLRAGFKENALSYLLFLRLVPVFPFWLVNLAPAVLGVPLGTYVFATFVGIIPGTFVIASAGGLLDSTIAGAQAQYNACIAAGGGNACQLSIARDPQLGTKLLVAAMLGVAALAPIAVKKWKMRRAK